MPKVLFHDQPMFRKPLWLVTYCVIMYLVGFLPEPSECFTFVTQTTGAPCIRSHSRESHFWGIYRVLVLESFGGNQAQRTWRTPLPSAVFTKKCSIPSKPK